MRLEGQLHTLATGQIKASRAHQAPDTSQQVLEPPGPARREGGCHDERARSTLGRQRRASGTDSILDSGPHERGRVISLWTGGESP